MNIVEDALSKSVFKSLQDKIFSPNVPWYFLGNTAYEDVNDNPLDGTYIHMVFQDREIKSPLFDSIYFAFLNCLDQAGEELKELLRIRIGVCLATENSFVHGPHVDYKEFEHKSALLYLNDNDGDTIFYNEFFGEEPATEFARVTPQENKFVYFDGYRYHSSSTPTNTKRRIVINFNYL